MSSLNRKRLTFKAGAFKLIKLIAHTVVKQLLCHSLDLTLRYLCILYSLKLLNCS